MMLSLYDALILNESLLSRFKNWWQRRKRQNIDYIQQQKRQDQYRRYLLDQESKRRAFFRQHKY